MGRHLGRTIITRPPGYRGGVRPIYVLTWSTIAAGLAGVVLGLLLATGVSLLLTGLWPGQLAAPVPCPQIFPDPTPSPLDSQWRPVTP